VLLAVLAIGLAMAPFDPPAFSQDPEVTCPGYRAVETTGYSTGVSLWPPGATDCEYTTPTGAVRHSTFMPWLDYAVLVLLAASGWMAFAALRRLVPPSAVRVYDGVAIMGCVAAVLLIGAVSGDLVPVALIAAATGVIAMRGFGAGETYDGLTTPALRRAAPRSAARCRRPCP
jgi:hypothetical protein